MSIFLLILFQYLVTIQAATPLLRPFPKCEGKIYGNQKILVCGTCNEHSDLKCLSQSEVLQYFNKYLFVFMQIHLKVIRLTKENTQLDLDRLSKTVYSGNTWEDLRRYREVLFLESDIVESIDYDMLANLYILSNMACYLFIFFNTQDT